MKNKRFHVADNTILDCPNVNYKYNRDTYIIEKRLFWILSIIGVMIALGLIIFSNNEVIKTVSGAFLGGVLSLIVWLFTIRQQDKINYELANIDMHIMKIDGYIGQLNVKTKFINPDDEELIDYDTSDIRKRFLLLLGITTYLNNDDAIDTSNITLHMPGEKNCVLSDYVSKWNEILINQEFGYYLNDKDMEKDINWNYWYLDWQLNNLKDKLSRYRCYILCGNAPESYSDYRSGNSNARR
ncbi:hypothetical protein [Pseudobutyrivibrio sp.]|uniref:hypothetical protein n=1 Tax=Pseudobutyrivibrio sp. TaxID=2014367 RepID=UPI0025FC8561|nr:hypothetical protein [Pseudobutyrivibrio sp.]